MAAEIQLTITNQPVDQDYADAKRRQLDAEWERYVQRGAEAARAARGEPEPDTVLDPAQFTLAAEPEAAPEPAKPSALKHALDTAAQTNQAGINAIAAALAQIAVPLEGERRNPIETTRKVLMEGLFPMALAPFIGAAAGGGQALENLSPEIAGAELFQGGPSGPAFTARHLLAGAPALQTIPRDVLQQMQQPMTVREGLELAGQFVLPLGVKPGVKAGKAVGRAVKEQAPNLLSERGSFGPQPPPEGAQTGPVGRPEGAAYSGRPRPEAEPVAAPPAEPAPAPAETAPPRVAGEARINVERLTAEDAIKGVARAVNALAAEPMAARRATRTHADLLQKAKDLGLTVDRALALDPDTVPLAEAEAYQQAFRDLNLATDVVLYDLARRVKAGDPTARQALKDTYLVSDALSQKQEIFGEHFARGTEARRIGAEAGRAGTFDPVEFQILRDRMGTAEGMSAETLADRLLAVRSASAKARRGWIRATVDTLRLGTNAAHSVWINFMLSNPVTHAANLTGTGLMQIYEIPERAVSGAVGELFRGIEILRGQTPGDHMRFAETAATYHAVAKGLADGVRLAGMALTDRPVGTRLSPAAQKAAKELLQRTQVELRPFSAETYGFDPASAFGQFVDTVGAIGSQVAVPTRLLGAEDAIMKGIAFNVELEALAIREAKARGARGAEFKRTVADLVSDPPGTMLQAAIDGAFLRTLNAELGTVGQAAMVIANETPGGRVIFPFIRTPTNAGKFVMQRAPVLQFLSLQNLRDIQAGGAARDRAIGRMALGNAVAALVWYETMQGNFIGQGPFDPRLRRDFFAAPKDEKTPRRVPNSWLIGDTYVSLDRLDPVLGTFLTTVVNAAEIVGQLPQPQAESDDEIDYRLQLFLAMGLGASRVMVNKSSLRGLSDVLESIKAPERSGERVIKSLARSAVPAGARHATTRYWDDGAMRDMRNVVSQIKAGVPGYSADVPPRVQRVTGDPVYYPPAWGPDMVSPVTYGMRNGDPVLDQLVANKVAISDWPEFLPAGSRPDIPLTEPVRVPPVKLKLHQIHRLATITTQEVQINGMTQYEYVKTLVQSGPYLAHPDEEPAGMRSVMLRAAFRSFLQLGIEKLLDEEDALAAAVGHVRTRRMEKLLPTAHPRSPHNPANQRLQLGR